jgi:hypothetical protein
MPIGDTMNRVRAADPTAGMQDISQGLQQVASTQEASPQQTMLELNQTAKLTDAGFTLIVGVMLEMAKRISALEGTQPPEGV